MSKKKETARHMVEDRLYELLSLKRKAWVHNESIEWKKKANMKGNKTNADKNIFKTNVWYAVKMQKDAELSANMPEYQFIPLNDKWVRNKRIVKESWKYWWARSETDRVVSWVASSSTTYWTGIMYEWIRHIYKNIKTPYYKEDEEWNVTIDFKEEKKLVYSWVYCEKIPFRNFFVNWTCIEDSTEAIVVTYYDRDDYMAEKELSPMYKNLNKVGKSQKDYKFNSDTDDWAETVWESTENVVTELRYYNSARDEYIIIANGIEILNSHIPYTHKDLPFCLFYDNMSEDSIWGVGEFEIIEDDEIAKDKYRELTVKAVRAAIWFWLWEKGSELEMEDLKFGLQELYETDDIDSVKHIAPNTPIQAISEIEAKIDNDIISKTGVDFKNLLLSPSESATRTASKSNSARKRINKNLKDNGYNFFTRLARLRMSNIQFLHTHKSLEIPIEWGSITNDWLFVKSDTGEYGLAKIGKNFVEWEFFVVPITETLLGSTEQRRKDNLANFAKLFWSLKADDGVTNIIKQKQIVKLWADEYGYDYDKLTEEWEQNKSADDVVDGIFWWGNSPSGQAKEADPSNPAFIPPEQRSGASDQIGSIPWQAKITPDEEL